MTSSFFPVFPILLLLSWQAEPGTTYTAQRSPDLQAWETLPFVIVGAGTEENLGVDHPYWPAFARLRYSSDGDSNGNGLPDLWEWEQFGYLDVDPEADPDGDGKSNLWEWELGTEPLDFFDGEYPVLQVSSGDHWLVPADTVSTQALAVSLSHPSGEGWPGAPVRIRMSNGRAAILHGGEDPVAEAVFQTDRLGRINPGIAFVQLLASSLPGEQEIVLIEAGPVTAHLYLETIGSDMGAPPRELRREHLETGALLYSWKGDPAGATDFLVEEQDPAGEWHRVLHCSVAQLPQPDPVTKQFTLIQ